MSRILIPATILFLISGFTAPLAAQPMEPDSLYTLSYPIGRQHWLWLERVAKEDPRYLPANYPENIRSFEIHGNHTPPQLFADAGIEMGQGEAINAGVRAPQVIIRATGRNHVRILALMKTIQAWERGRTDEWHHSAVRARRNDAQ